MRHMIGLSFITIILGFVIACASLPKRVYEQKQMKLDPQENELVRVDKVDDYVEDVMNLVKGYKEPETNADENLSLIYIAISGGMFVLGFVFFGIAYLTRAYKCNYIGFLLLVGAGTAAGVAELAGLWWILPVTALLGGLVWYFTHKNKDFSLPEKIKNFWSDTWLSSK